MTEDFKDILSTKGSEDVCNIVHNYSTACGKVSDLYPIEKAMAIPAWAALILAACIVCGETKLGTHSNTNNIHYNSVRKKMMSSNHEEKEEYGKKVFEETSTLKVGRTINVFPRYGNLTETLKILPSRSSDKWLFREASSEIFQSNSYWAKYGGTTKKGSFDGHYLIDFCDTSKDLYTAYFDHFEIEGIPRTYKAFISFLNTKTIAQSFGIYSAYLTIDDFSFVLVRLFRRETHALLDGALRLNQNFVNASRKIRIGSSESAHQFIDNFGSHVIVEYELGDVIYQVFVFGQRVYNELKTAFALSYEEAKWNFTSFNQSPSELLNINGYFNAENAVQVGQVRMASGCSEFEKLRKRRFPARFYPSIFEILKETDITEELAKINSQVITGMRLKKITKALTPTPERYWLSVILDNTLSLYYVTI